MTPDLNLGDALRQAVRILGEADIESPRLTAEVLLAHATGRDRTYLHTHPEAPLTELAWIHYGRWLRERIDGKPLQYITRKQEFWGREFHVAPGVLIPRPETEHVIERALEIGPPVDGAIVDAGTGSGCIAVTLALEWNRPVFAVDRSAEALQIARRNQPVKTDGSPQGASVHWIQGDWLTAIRGAGLVVTNPPYVPAGDTLPREVGGWEPSGALFAGPDGLDAWRRLIEQTPAGAWLVGEIDSRAEMLPLFDHRWTDVEIRPDLAGRPRVVSARRLAR
jgi:release factor glutamine methyltransferase